MSTFASNNFKEVWRCATNRIPILNSVTLNIYRFLVVGKTLLVVMLNSLKTLVFGCRFMEPLTSNFPFLVTFGNHEIEKSDNGAYFIGAIARYKTPANESNSANPTYYSADISGMYCMCSIILLIS